MSEVEDIVRRALKSGKYYFGSRRTIKALKKGEAKAVVVSKNCPEEFLQEIKKFNVPIYVFDGTNMQLGEFCGKPFSIASMAILEM
ncbi:MAG: 50S ribosomal protein L30e [Archaeoglobi archaeon]|jgi:large subunit ribosomal protein L30e|nr:50S ribosomal protein L30e [Archaeoglobus sp.]NHW88707.1 50S ribosomal protein L30e [Archaeoglobales archaeon]TDA28496.1 MAG: 50S ribosomal protein L30e [Archaeoglobi archaeon]